MDDLLRSIGGLEEQNCLCPPRIGDSRLPRWKAIVEAGNERKSGKGDSLQIALQELFAEDLEILAQLADVVTRNNRQVQLSELRFKLLSLS